MRLVGQNLHVMRGEDEIIRGLDFVAEQGRALVVTGANGAGKSTLLRAIAGLLPLTLGQLELTPREAEFDGKDLGALCHYLGHANAMKPAMTVWENLEFWRNMSGMPHLEISEALEMVGLDGLEGVPFAHLSTGQRRRIGIARLVINYRPVWLLDEPTAGLDAASHDQFVELMGAHLDDGGLIVTATHIPFDLPQSDELFLGAGA